MNVHWNAPRDIPKTSLAGTIFFEKPLTSWEKVQDVIARFGMLAIVAILVGEMAYGFYLNQAATNDECFANFYLSECAR